MHPIFVLFSLAGAVTAQSITPAPALPTQTVVDLFLGAKRKSNYTFVGNVLEANDAATTYHITCKSGDLNLPGFPTTTCDLKDPVTSPNLPSTIDDVYLTLSLRIFN